MFVPEQHKLCAAGDLLVFTSGNDGGEAVAADGCTRSTPQLASTEEGTVLGGQGHRPQGTDDVLG